MNRKYRRLAILLAMVGAGVLVAGAIAFWTSSGDGTAAATTTSPDPVTLIPGDPTGFLYPGTSADVAVKITNPNPFPVNVPSLVLDIGTGDGGFDVDGGHSGCDLSTLSYTTQNNSGPGWTVPGTNTPPNYLVLDLASAVSMSTTAETECQGATFTVYLQVGS